MTQLTNSYSTFLKELKQRIRGARLRTVISVNRELILLYWSIGRDIRARQRSRAVLNHQIKSHLAARQGRAITNFTRTLPAAQSDLAQQLMKDPYSFEFLALDADLRERELHLGLLEHLRSLLLELGKGFAFVGSQYPVEVGDQDYFIDLLFYHLRLRCFIVIELKVEGFKPEFAGKMNFYLSAVDDRLRHPDDQPSIGIILCGSRNEIVVEYALRGSSKPMGVAQYRLSSALPECLQHELPTAEDLEERLRSKTATELRDEIESSLRDVAAASDIPAERPIALRALLSGLKQQGKASSRSEDLLEAWQAMENAGRATSMRLRAQRRCESVNNFSRS